MNDILNGMQLSVTMSSVWYARKSLKERRRMNEIRTSELDYAQVWENTVTALSNYLEKNKLETMVLSISGGIERSLSMRA